MHRSLTRTCVCTHIRIISLTPSAGDLDPVMDTLGGFRDSRVAEALMFHVHISSRSRGNSASSFVHYQKFRKVGREGNKGGGGGFRGKDRQESFSLFRLTDGMWEGPKGPCSNYLAALLKKSYSGPLSSFPSPRAQPACRQ